MKYDYLAPEATEGEGEGAEAVEGEEGAEGLPEGYPVDEEAAAEGMKVEVRKSPLTTKTLTPNMSHLYFFKPLYFYQKRKKTFLLQAEATEEPSEAAPEEEAAEE